MDREEILYVDATPDEGYPIRILEAYRQRCDYKWSMSSDEIKENELMKSMNDAQDLRAEILERALAKLRG